MTRRLINVGGLFVKILAENKDRVVNCKHCDCLYEYEYKDALLIGVGVVGIVCPKCETMTMFKVTTQFKEIEQTEIGGTNNAGSSV